MLKNAYVLAKIGADTAENGRNFVKKFTKNWRLSYGSIPAVDPRRRPLHWASPCAARRPPTRAPGARAPGPSWPGLCVWIFATRQEGVSSLRLPTCPFSCSLFFQKYYISEFLKLLKLSTRNYCWFTWISFGFPWDLFRIHLDLQIIPLEFL